MFRELEVKRNIVRFSLQVIPIFPKNEVKISAKLFQCTKVRKGHQN
jgi:hypothetical protein